MFRGFRNKNKKIDWKKVRDYINDKELTPYRRWAKNTIRSHKNSGYEVFLPEEKLAIIAHQTSHCYICHQKLSWFGKPRDTSLPSLDRVNNEKYLTLDNIAIVCMKCNWAKRQMPMAEFIRYCQKVAKVWS